MIPRILRQVLATAPWAAVAACSGSAAAGGMAATVRDSAGVEIVDHPAALVAALPEWVAEGDPILDLGSAETEAEEFSAIRSAVRFADGRVLLAEGGSNELRLFGPGGEFLATWARRGQGPGEFTGISTIERLPGDSVAVLDLNGRRTQLFAPDGTLLRVITHPRLAAETGYLGIGNLMHDGRLLGSLTPQFVPPTSTDGPVTRDTLAFLLMPADGSRADTLDLAPGFERFPGQFSEGGQSFASYGSVTFGRSTYLATDGVRIALGTNEANEVRVYEGLRLVRVIRDGTPAEPVTEEHRAQRLREDLARIDRMNAPAELRESLKRQSESQRRHAAVFPWYERLLFGTDGSLWVEGSRRFEDEGRRYTIYDTAGRAVARAVFPDRVRPLQVGPDHLVGMWRDPDEVPHLRVWRVGSRGGR